VVSRRNATQSDLVVLYRAPGRLCGLSSGFNGFQPTGEPDHIDPELDAFNVVALDSPGSCGSLVAAHEIGHSLSAGHDYASSVAGAALDRGAPVLQVYWKPYAHALACQGDNTAGYFSMMWGPGIGGPGIGGADEPGGRTDIITNPDALLADGRPCGSTGVDGVPASQANNVKAMSEGAPYVAAHRGSATTATGAAQSSGAGGGGAILWGQLLVLMAIRLLRSTRRSAR
jgi:hypothetical protein